jgi:hypothetical protein
LDATDSGLFIHPVRSVSAVPTPRFRQVYYDTTAKEFVYYTP